MTWSHSSYESPGRLLTLSAELNEAETVQSAVTRAIELVEAAFDHPSLGASTIPELFVGTAARHPAAAAQSYKGGVSDRSLVAADAIPAAPDGAYTDLSYSDLEAVVGRLAAGFRDLGLEADDRLAIVSHSRMEWTQVDLAALAAQGRLRATNGRRHTWFCGAWMRHGFHEDGLSSGLDVAEAISARAVSAQVAAE